MWTEYVNFCEGRDIMKRTFCPQTGGTFMGMELKKTIVAADHRAQYDECVKKLLSHKEILAHILVHTVDEFKGMNPKDVVDYIPIMMISNV